MLPQSHKKVSLQFSLCLSGAGLLLLVAISFITQPVFGQIQDGPRNRSQIIDDSTKQVYGPTTSRFFYEEDVFYNQEKLFVIDTVIRNFHRFTYVQRYNNFYQDLGNIGTGSRTIYYNTPENIGVSPGVTAYDLYWDAKSIRYFNTRSPYSNMKISLGGKGRSVTDIVFSRNINPRWNIGFDFKTLSIDKQVQRLGKGDRNVRRTYYDFFTSFQTKDSTYRLFFNFARNKHQVLEYGGVLVDQDNYQLSEFFLDDISPSLTSAESNELRMNLHLFHQYEVGKALQLYHQLDRYRQGNQFMDDTNNELSSYFDYVEVDSAQAHDEIKFVSLRNELGVKGNLLKLFYNGYYAIRNYSMEYKYIDEDSLSISTLGAEHYLGGRMALQLDSLLQLRGSLEVQNNGNVRIQGSLRSKWLEASLKQLIYSPGYMQQAYRGSHDVWNNNFNNTEASQISGFAYYRSPIFSISPGVTITRLKNYVFFHEDTTGIQDVLPYQSAGEQIITAPELRASVTFFKNFNIQIRGIYTSVLENSDNAIRIPELFINSQLSYSNIFFKGNLELHTGFDFHWKSDYKPLGYDPVIQQFYTQDRFVAPSFPLVDFFVNGKIKRARIFVKYHNLIQAFTGEGYFPTPFYPGQQNIIDFGFDWSFYD